MERFRKAISWLFGAGLIVNAVIFIPQLLSIWAGRNVDGISLLTFGFFCLMQFVGTLHGIFQRDKALAFGMGASLLTCGAVTLSVFYLRYIA